MGTYMTEPAFTIHEDDLSFAAYRAVDAPKGIVLIWRGDWEATGTLYWDGAEWTTEMGQVYAKVSEANFETWVKANIEAARAALAVLDARG